MRAQPRSHPSRACRRLAGAALTVAVTGITAPAALAADAGNLEVSPSPARPGTTVTLTTDACGTGGSAGVDASSLGGGILGLQPQDAESGTAAGTLHIPADTKPGNYAVGGSCTDGQQVTGTVLVGEDQRSSKGKSPTKESHAKESPEAGGPAAGNPPADRPAKEAPAAGIPSHDRNADHDAHRPPGHSPQEVSPGHEWEPHDHGDGQDHRAGDPHQHPDRHGAMPHGRVHTGFGGGSDGMSTGRLAGGSLALAAAVGGVLHLRRRHRAGEH